MDSFDFNERQVQGINSRLTKLAESLEEETMEEDAIEEAEPLEEETSETQG